LPNEEEQNIIAKFLLEVDKTVNNQLVKTKLLKQRKKGLLQRMFV
ncbi:TPA: restriction endonuclease subunit S, partial [Staphylococcus aureus]|nr:restriction endonuclease subunit S [Staphylococcus aureus]HCX9291700.1 restriction endonuclease subunit S [Staphylococcus aureus]